MQFASLGRLDTVRSTTWNAVFTVVTYCDRVDDEIFLSLGRAVVVAAGIGEFEVGVGESDRGRCKAEDVSERYS